MSCTAIHREKDEQSWQEVGGGVVFDLGNVDLRGPGHLEAGIKEMVGHPALELRCLPPARVHI